VIFCCLDLPGGFVLVCVGVKFPNAPVDSRTAVHSLQIMLYAMATTPSDLRTALNELKLHRLRLSRLLAVHYRRNGDAAPAVCRQRIHRQHQRRQDSLSPLQRHIIATHESPFDAYWYYNASTSWGRSRGGRSGVVWPRWLLSENRNDENSSSSSRTLQIWVVVGPCGPRRLQLVTKLGWKEEPAPCSSRSWRWTRTKTLWWHWITIRAATNHHIRFTVEK